MTVEQQDEQLGLAHWLDGFLFRLETSELSNRWFEVKRRLPERRLFLVSVLAVLSAGALAGGWLYGRSEAGQPVELRIPQATGRAASPDLESADSEDGNGSVSTDSATRSNTAASSGGLDQESTDAVDGGSVTRAGTEAGVDGTTASDADVADLLVVHVAGAVVRPGLVTVVAGARVNDAVVAAGGADNTADLDRLNLAAPVEDGMQILVPTIDEDGSGPYLIRPDGPGAAGHGPGPAEPIETGPVNLNTATVEMLDTLPGVGPATAGAIVTWREQNGGFHSLDDLLAVPGIGPAKMAAIGDLAVL